jgi:hypothetical protein
MQIVSGEGLSSTANGPGRVDGSTPGGSLAGLVGSVIDGAREAGSGGKITLPGGAILLRWAIRRPVIVAAADKLCGLGVSDRVSIAAEIGKSQRGGHGDDAVEQSAMSHLNPPQEVCEQ